jgi:hypothetical protein
MAKTPKAVAPKTMAFAAAPAVNLPPPSQADLLILLLNQKIGALLHARQNVVGLLTSGALPVSAGTAILQNIDGEIERCALTIQTLHAGQQIIQFPTPAQITALRAAVEALGQITVQGASAQQLATAIGDLVATFPD